MWLPDCSKLVINRKIWHDVIFNFLGGCFVSLVKLSILVIGPSFMWITLLVLELWQFCYKGLTRNPEIKNTPVWVFKLTGVFGISVLHSTISLVTLLGLINVNESHFDWYMLVSIYCFKSNAHMYRNFLRHHPIGGCLCYLIENVPRSNLCKESILFIVK